MSVCHCCSSELQKIQQVIGTQEAGLQRLQGEVLELKAHLSSSQQQARSLRELSDGRQAELHLAQEASAHVEGTYDTGAHQHINPRTTQPCVGKHRSA